MSGIYKDGQWYGKSGGGSEYTAGDGINIENDEISTDNMSAEDMSEVASPMPSVMSRLPILFDESGAERIVGWYKYADGTKKPVYERAITGLSIRLSTAEVDIPLPADINIDVCIKAVIYDPSISSQIPLACLINFSGHNYFYNTTSSTWNDLTTLILQYTKTTDTPQ